MAEYDIVSMLAYAADRLDCHRNMYREAPDQKTKIDFICEYNGMREILSDMGIHVENDEHYHTLKFCGITATANDL